MMTDAKDPVCFTHIGPQKIFTTIHEDGWAEIYCEGDVHLTRNDLKELLSKISAFVYARELYKRQS
jgi:hypothetical protein